MVPASATRASSTQTMCNAQTQTCEELDVAESKAIANIDAPKSCTEWLDGLISYQSRMEMGLRSEFEFLVEGQKRGFQKHSSDGDSPFEDEGLHGDDDDEVRSFSLSVDGPVELKRSVSEPSTRTMACAPDPVKMLSNGEMCIKKAVRGEMGEDSERSVADTQLNASQGDGQFSPDQLFNLLTLVKVPHDLLPVAEQPEQGGHGSAETCMESGKGPAKADSPVKLASSKSLQSLHPSLPAKPVTRVRAMHAAVTTSTGTSSAPAVDLSQVEINIAVAAASDPDSPRAGSGPSEASIGSVCSAFTCRSKASSGSQPVSPRPLRTLKGAVSMPALNRSGHS